jgi:hypothetical protein
MRADFVVCIDVGKTPSAPIAQLPGYKQHIMIADPTKYSIAYSNPTQIAPKYFHIQVDTISPVDGISGIQVINALQALPGFMGAYFTLDPPALGNPVPF